MSLGEWANMVGHTGSSRFTLPSPQSAATLFIPAASAARMSEG